MKSDEEFERSLENSEVIILNDYKYFINPLTDGVHPITPDLLKSAAEKLSRFILFDDLINCNKLVTPEAMGIPITTMVSNITKIPFLIVRKRKYGLKGELHIEQVTGYSRNDMYLNGVNPNDNIIIIDAILSTGGTIKGLLEAIQKCGAKIISVIVLVNKNTTNIEKEIEQKFQVPVRYLYKTKIENNRVVICQREI